MPSTNTLEEQRVFNRFLAAALNLLPLPVGLGYLYLRENERAIWSSLLRVAFLAIAGTISAFALPWVAFVKCGDDGDCIRWTDWARPLVVPVGIMLIVSAARAFNLATKINSGRRDI